MRTPQPTPGTVSTPPWLKASRVLAALITLAAGLALTAVGWSAHSQPARRSVAGATKRTIPPKAKTASAPVGVSRSIRVVGIGDSVTSGYNCTCEPFVGLYANALANQRGLATSAVNLGVAGSTSSQLLQSVSRPGTFRDQVADADIVLVTIGANDLSPLESKQPADCPTTCYSPLIDTMAHEVELIVKAARAAQPDHSPTVLVTDYWNVFQDGDVGTAENGSAFQSFSDTLTRAASIRVCDATRRAGATCVSLYPPFKGDGSANPTSLLADDGDHPNAAGHQLISSTLLAATPEPLP